MKQEQKRANRGREGQNKPFSATHPLPITQSPAWRQLQNDLGERSFFVDESDFCYLAILKPTPVGNYLYLPYGPVYARQNGLSKALASLTSLASAEGAVFVRVEPRDPKFAAQAPHNAQKSLDLNPKETWQLDLRGNDDTLRARLPSRLLRYHKNAAMNGLVIETSHDPADIHYLVELQRALAREKGINTFSAAYLGTELAQPFATLYLVRLASDPHTVLAAGLVFDHGDTRYNLQGAQSEQGKKLHATGILTIQLILDAAARGLKTFDFWGIAPENAPENHPWAGFTAFKKTFAGREVDYAGTYDLVQKPFRYQLYRLTRGLNRFLRRM